MSHLVQYGTLAIVFLAAATNVNAAGRSPQAVAADVDALIEKMLTENKVPLSAKADDAEFIRRASLDITGRIPTAERVSAFLSETTPNKRARLIDELLADEEYGEHFAIIWYHRMVRIDDDNRYTVRGNTFAGWLEKSFNRNDGWNKIASNILMAQGPRDKNPETTFYLANVDDNKAGFNPAPNKITSAASKLFLGIKLECCECHNHPFNTLKQTDYWGVAAFFDDIHGDNTRKKELKDGAIPGVHEGAAVTKKKDSSNAPFGSIEIPDTKGKTVKAKYLLGTEAPLANHPSLRKLFVTWMTSPQNKYFSQAAVNKMWANFFGRGIVEPVDDIDMDKATHPDVLKLLSKDFAASGYDLKYLIRCICLSETYQRTSAVLPGNKDDEKLYSHMRAKVMSADMLYDSLEVVLGHGVGTSGKGPDVKKKTGGGREEFRKFFHADADDDVGVVDDYTHGVPQVLRLMNSGAISNSNALVTRLMKAGEPEKVIDSMYLTVLSRQPTAAEVQKMTAYAAADKFSTKAYSDLVCVLLNSGEFLFNH